MPVYHYRKVGDLYQLVDDETHEVLAEGPKIAIAFDLESFTLHKHGMADKVERWYTETRQKWYDAGLYPEAAALVLITSSEWDVLDLEKILDITGYIKRFLQNYGFRTGVRRDDQLGYRVPLLEGPETALAPVVERAPVDTLPCQIIRQCRRPRSGPLSAHGRKRRRGQS